MRLIQGGNNPKKSRGYEEPIRCPACNGVVFYKLVTSPRRKRLKWLKRSGEEKLMCVVCKEVVA